MNRKKAIEGLKSELSVARHDAIYFSNRLTEINILLGNTITNLERKFAEVNKNIEQKHINYITDYNRFDGHIDNLFKIVKQSGIVEVAETGDNLFQFQSTVDMLQRNPIYRINKVALEADLKETRDYMATHPLRVSLKGEGALKPESDSTLESRVVCLERRANNTDKSLINIVRFGIVKER